MDCKKAHLCTKEDLLSLTWDPECNSSHIAFKGTRETCMPSTSPLDTSRGIHINISPVIRAKGISMDFKIWSKDHGDAVFEIYDIKIQIVEAVTQITVSAVQVQPAIGSDVVYFMDYDLKFER